MASDGQPVKIPAVSLVQGSQAPTTVAIKRSGNVLPPAGKSPATSGSQLQAQVALLNKYLNDSGKPDQFRVDPASDDKLIQQVNPATGEVVGELPANEFEALARSVGISGVIVNKRA
ncbi:MAG TPA: flagellar protein FlaG [Steroidobacteraceae bacterium]